MARWMLLWLEANHVSGLPAEHIEAYVTRDSSALVDTNWEAAVEEAAVAREAELAADAPDGWRTPRKGSAAHAQLRLHAHLRLKLESGVLTSKAMQLINIAEEWLSTFLPHCLQKVDR